MAIYKTLDTSEYARMLREDALHALNLEVRKIDEDGNTTWVEEFMTMDDIAVIVDDSIRELAHHLKEALEDAITKEELARKAGITFDAITYIDERVRQASRFDDDWAWVYEEQEGML